MVTARLAYCAFVCFVCADMRLKSQICKAAQTVGELRHSDFAWPGLKGQGPIKWTECFASWCASLLKKKRKKKRYQRMHKGGLSAWYDTLQRNEASSCSSAKPSGAVGPFVITAAGALPPTAWAPCRCSCFLPQSGNVQCWSGWQLSLRV